MSNELQARFEHQLREQVIRVLDDAGMNRPAMSERSRENIGEAIETIAKWSAFELTKQQRAAQNTAKSA
jgi:hypothetical protein